MIHEVDEELRDIKREIVESRGLVIRTNNLTNALSADLRSIAKRQQTYERRISWNSAVSYIVFVIVAFVALKLVMDTRIDQYNAAKEQLTGEIKRLREELSRLQERERQREEAEERANQFYDLARQGKRLELVKQWEILKDKPLSRSEAAVFADVAERTKNELAGQYYAQGLERVRAQRWQEAANAFEESIRYKEDASIGPGVRLGLADAYRHLNRQKDALGILTALADNPVDKEVHDDALYLLAWCQAELQSYNDAKNTWRTLLRRFPESHFAPEARLQLAQLQLMH